MARRYFTKAKNSVYGTDDRGLIYVKYGEPDRHRVIHLGTRSSEIYNVASLSNISARFWPDLRREVEWFTNYPECEAWSYSDLHEDAAATYLFGSKEGEGVFGLQNGVEDFIPARAFRRSSLVMGLPAGAVIQMMYYADLSEFNLAFADRLREVVDLFVRSRVVGRRLSPNVVRGVRQRFELSDNSNHLWVRVPLERSDIASSFPALGIVSVRGRLLDKAGEPRLVFTAATLDQMLSEKGQLVGQEPRSHTETHFTLIVRNQDMEELSRLRAKPKAELQGIFAFELPHRETQAHYTLAVKVYNQEGPAGARVHQKHVAVGKKFFGMMPILDTNTRVLEVSDPIVGVGLPSKADTNFPFPVLPRAEIGRDSPLKVYLEIYHLQLDAEGMGHFDLDCRIIAIRTNDKQRRREKLIATSFEFVSQGGSAKEDIGISVRNLKPGDYELEVEIADRKSGQKKSRSAFFHIVE